MLPASRGAVRRPTAPTKRCHHAWGADHRRIESRWSEAVPGTSRSRRIPGRRRNAAAPTTATVAATIKNAVSATVIDGSMALHLQLCDTPDHEESDHFEEDASHDEHRSFW